MVLSMTGYGRTEVSRDGVTVGVELRSVNSRGLELTLRSPRELNAREAEIRDILRRGLSRGKVNVSISVDREAGALPPLAVDRARAAQLRTALDEIRAAAGIDAPVALDHMLRFPEMLFARTDMEGEEQEATDEWPLVAEALSGAIVALETMRRNEGGELARDLAARIAAISAMVDEAEGLSRERVPAERERLRERVAQLIEEVDEARLELEIILLADRLDITEECVRYRSHARFFLEAMEDGEPAGRRLNFLVQEINREINTIGSKSNDATIARLVVRAKEELEKIREQVQNIE